MRYRVNLLESDSQIRNNILEAIQNTLESAINKTISSLPDKIKPIVSQALKTEPEYQSLTSGQLRLEFGISDVGAVNNVIEQLVNTLSITYDAFKKSNFGLSGGIQINMIKKEDAGGVIFSDSAVVKDDKNGYSLPWLEWLLLKGNDSIVKNFSVRFGQYSSSRSGGAIMVSSQGDWRVPPQFVGTVDNNWTTRAIDKVEKDISDVIRQTLESYI